MANDKAILVLETLDTIYEDDDPDNLPAQVSQLTTLLPQKTINENLSIANREANVMAIVSRRHTEAVNELCHAETFDVADFASKLLQKYNFTEPTTQVDAEHQWAGLSLEAAKLFTTPYQFYPLQGAFNITAASTLTPLKVKKKRVTQNDLDETEAQGRRGVVREIEGGENIGVADEADKWSKMQIQHIYKVLGTVTRQLRELDGDLDATVWIDVMKFVIDPQSFNHSCENLFHFSFLLKAQRMVLTYDEDGRLLMRMARSNEMKHKESGEETSSQLHYEHWAVNFTREMWKSEIEQLNLVGQSPMIASTNLPADLNTSASFLHGS